MLVDLFFTEIIQNYSFLQGEKDMSVMHPTRFDNIYPCLRL